MKDVIFDNFQNAVDNSLLRHKSILDIITKLDESQSRISRAIVKSVTNCGCVEIEAKKQRLPEHEEDMDIESLRDCMKSHINGKLCDNCRSVVESEIGNNLFYLTALCNELDINLYDILLKEYDKIDTLGKYSFR